MMDKQLGTTGTGTQPALASPEERAAARHLLGQIGQRFSDNRKKGKSAAFEAYQRDLAENMDTLVLGQAVTLKEITTLIMDLEAYIKQASGAQGDSPTAIVAKFLRGELADIDLQQSS